MTGIDESSKERPVPRPKWKLPRIIDMKISLIPHRPPKFRYLKSYLSKYEKAVEFLVKTSGPIPIRALSPALFVGDTAVVEVQAIDEDSCRFLAFELDKLQEGAPIFFGWIGQDEAGRMKTEFKYHLEGGQPASLSTKGQHRGG